MESVTILNTPRLSKEFLARRSEEAGANSGDRPLGIANSGADIPIMYQGASDKDPFFHAGSVTLNKEAAVKEVEKKTSKKSVSRQVEVTQTISAPAAPVLEKPTMRVRLSGAGMGRMTLTVRQVAISDTLVVLAYDNDSPAIVEPPVAYEEEPITVEFDGKTYKCVFGQWTVTVGDLFLVVLILLPQ